MLKAYAVVAHPDDCLIYAKCLIDNYITFDWTIVYLTYNNTDLRAVEVSNYWLSRDIKTQFLGFFDMYHDLETEKLNYWHKDDAIFKIQQACKQADVILTHNKFGEYGHIHHKVVHEAVSVLAQPKIYFADNSFYTDELESKFDLSLNEFPLHHDVLVGCNLNTSKYNITNEVKTLINTLHENSNIR